MMGPLSTTVHAYVSCRNTPAQAPLGNGATGPDPVLISERILGRPKHPLSTPLHAHTARLHIVPSAHQCMRMLAGTPQHRLPQSTETQDLTQCSSLSASWAAPKARPRPGHW
jgi:hypothetical protein